MKTNLQKVFVSYNIACELKKIGYDEDCLAYWHKPIHYAKKEELVLVDPEIAMDWNSVSESESSAPTWEQAREWIETKHNLFITIIPMLISASNKGGHRFTFFTINLSTYDEAGDESPLGFLTYEEARELAFLNAIELCKNNL